MQRRGHQLTKYLKRRLEYDHGLQPVATHLTSNLFPDNS